MTSQSDLKAIIRARQHKTGESYTIARLHILGRRDAMGAGPVEEAAGPRATGRLEAAVLKVGAQSARVRIAGEEGEVTFRSRDAWRIVPGHWVTLQVEKRWLWRGDDYASGSIEAFQVDVARVGLQQLAFEDPEFEDVAEYSEPFVAPDPYAAMWRRFTAKPRPALEFDAIAWGELPGASGDDNLTCIAADMIEQGEVSGAREKLMEALHRDLRCLDAHAHLASLAFEHDVECAMAHYEVGVRIGDSLLPASFDGLLPWDRIYNRPFLRCLHGHALCLWRSRRFPAAVKAFERLLAFNPNDNQGARFCWSAVREGVEWAAFESGGRDPAAFTAAQAAQKLT